LSVGDTLYAISEAGLTLTVSETEGTLKVYPAENITPELAVAIQEHKADIIRIMREDEEFHRTGVIQSERQVFELARDHFGLNHRGGSA
jgi:hypothetical protein